MREREREAGVVRRRGGEGEREAGGSKGGIRKEV